MAGSSDEPSSGSRSRAGAPHRATAAPWNWHAIPPTDSAGFGGARRNAGGCL